jgi:hypothetical protein
MSRPQRRHGTGSKEAARHSHTPRVAGSKKEAPHPDATQREREVDMDTQAATRGDARAHAKAERRARDDVQGKKCIGRQVWRTICVASR